MRTRPLLATAGLAALIAAFAANPFAATPAQAETMANAQLKDGSGKAIGDADLVQTQAGVLIRLRIKGLPAGERAFHIHAVGKCEAPFESAGPHFNPDNHKHGMLSGHGHAGDMPNLHVPQSGELSVEVMNTAVIIGPFTAVLGSILVALDTAELPTFLQLPPWSADFLRYRLAGQ